MKYELNHVSLCPHWGEDPTIDKIISLLGDCEDAGDGNISISSGDLLVDITRNRIDLCEDTETGAIEFGSIKFIDGKDNRLIRKYLEAYFITNEDVLEAEDIDNLKRLIRLF